MRTPAGGAWPKVRAYLWAWNAIGVADAAPTDEYDCVIGPLARMLARGAGRVELTRRIGTYRRQHFGLASDRGRTTISPAA